MYGVQGLHGFIGFRAYRISGEFRLYIVHVALAWVAEGQVLRCRSGLVKIQRVSGFLGAWMNLKIGDIYPILLSRYMKTLNPKP